MTLDTFFLLSIAAATDDSNLRQKRVVRFDEKSKICVAESVGKVDNGFAGRSVRI
jgi:hypothetical protein